VTYYAGIELGGTKLVAIRANGRTITDRVTIPTTDPGETLGRAVDVLRGWHDAQPFAAIGIGSFGPVRIDPAAPDYGSILSTPKAGWAGTDLLAPFKRFEVPLALDTDVNAAALAEAAMGAGRGCDTLVYLTIGTGIGGGLVAADTLSDATFVTLSEGLSWSMTGGKTRTESDLGDWLGKRAGAGRMAPRGFPRNHKFD